MALSPMKCSLLMFICFWQVSYLASTCPESCTCHNNLTLALCSFNVTLKENSNVYHVPVCCEDDERTWSQEFANKTLSEVSVRYRCACGEDALAAFASPALDTRSLTITNSNLTKITIVVKILNLREIDLSRNRLKSITNGLFNNFSYLQKLILSKNEITNIFIGSFNGLTKLESLDLSENNLTLLTNVFTPLKNLQHLNLSRNNIEFIHGKYFNNWLLQHLDVSHNNLKRISPGALQQLPNLARLLLGDNPALGGAAPAPAQLLVGAGRRLQQLDAARTGLARVPEAFTPSVRFLSLVGNRISAVRCGDLDSYPLLQSLDFSDNEIDSVEDDSLGRLEMLLFLNINKNVLPGIPRSLPDELKYLSVSDNLISNLSIHDLKNLPNLRILLLQHNQIRYIEDHVFDDLLSLEMLDLSNNPIQALSPSTFEGPLALRDLRLCFLNVSAPAPAAVGGFPAPAPGGVQMLHLQASPGLARQLLADSAALAAFSHLQYLDLRMNNLTEIRNDLLFYLSQLKTLRLHGNGMNCSAKTWLRDWMSWNKSTSTGESCYYSTSETKDEITKYNCTFPETFTISESLPPVNLYSTEMINKLLRYYGYLNNKTEKVPESLIRNKSKYNSSDNDYDLTLNDTIDKDTKHAIISIYSERKLKGALKLSHHELSNETQAIKSRELAKSLEQNKLLHDQLNIDQRFLDSESHFSPEWRNSKKGNDDDISKTRQNNKSGKRLNTPVEDTKVLKTKSVKNESHSATLSNVTRNETGPGVSGAGLAGNINEKSQSSPYASPPASYAQYLGTLAVSALIALALVLWASFRRRHRRRRAPAEPADHIEVASISGRVLW